MNVLISGSTGLIGSALGVRLEGEGHRVGRLVRPGGDAPAGEGDVAWDPAAGRIDAAGLEGWDAVVHLAGESIARRWTAARKARIRDSRIVGTTLLCEALAGRERWPGALVCASGVGYYGDRGEEVLTEDAPPGEGFLAEVCAGWEAATKPAADAGIRVVNARLAMVLSAEGGALRKMLRPFRMGLGGRIGSGRQYWSWVSLADAVSAICHALGTAALRGPVNLASPGPVTNRQFTRDLARVLGRPAVLPLPGFAARLLLGEMAEGLLLASARLRPRKLLESGFGFRHAELAPTLCELLA
ncbi:MAG TPA: TIGR01777 family oxidoreductase [Phycisphaerae bacterium]|nr:TIGR01777 family oxidoreductase [Phycisphaerae bacterium]